MEYDESNAIEEEIKFRLEEEKAINGNEALTEEQVRNQVYNGDCLDFYWEDIENYLTEIMQKKNPNGYWKAKMENFGWRSLDGLKYLKATTGKELVQKVLPNTNCTFKVFNFGKGLCIQNWHHDSPMGNEHYYLMPISYNIYEKNS